MKRLNATELRRFTAVFTQLQVTDDLERSDFQRRPCYRYIRQSDELPSMDQLPASGPMALVKLFDPCSAWTWYIAAYDPTRRMAYGLVHGLDTEYGYI